MSLVICDPVEMEGTYPLPEAQRDRFMARLSMGYPDPQSEVAMLGDREVSASGTTKIRQRQEASI